MTSLLFLYLGSYWNIEIVFKSSNPKSLLTLCVYYTPQPGSIYNNRGPGIVAADQMSYYGG